MLSPYFASHWPISEPLDLPRLDAAVGHGADVEQQVAVAADRVDQHVKTLLQRLQLIVRLPRPLLTDRHAGFPRPFGLQFADGLLRRVVVAGAAGAVVDHDVGLKRADPA